MPICDVYLGVEDTQFSWEPSDEAYRSLNLPRRLGPWFPASPTVPRFTLSSEVVDRINDGRYAGAKVDWGGWAAKVHRSDILKLVAEFYPGDFRYPSPPEFPNMYAHLDAALVKFEAFLATLEDRDYLLVASET